MNRVQSARLDSSHREHKQPDNTSGQIGGMSQLGGLQSELDVMIGVSGKLHAESLKWAMSSHGQFSNVEAEYEFDKLILAIRSGAPKLVLLDEETSNYHLQEIARQLPVRLQQTHIAVFADRMSLRQLDMAIPHVNAFLSHNDSISVFLERLQAACRGQKAISEHLVSKIRLDRGKNEFELSMGEEITRLTKRQMEVLTRIAQGMSAKRVAGELHITTKAVESHKYRLMRTLALEDRVELCRWAIREGIIPA